MPEQEGGCAADHAVIAEFFRYVPGGISGTQEDEFLSSGVYWQEQAPCQPNCDPKDDKRYEFEKRAHSNSLDDPKQKIENPWSWDERTMAREA
jgi:hypothetical protein